MTPDHRQILLDALASLARHDPIEHRPYGSTLAEIRQRLRDTAWASRVDRDFARERAFVARVAGEALDGQPDEALAVEALGAISDLCVHEDDDGPFILSMHPCSALAASLCADVARRALRACGLPAKPESRHSATVARFASDLAARTAAAHAGLAGTGPSAAHPSR